MHFLDLTLDTPAENLACDEALLDLCEDDGIETLRFWESPSPFVVVGYANKVESEVNAPECRRRHIPILRRCSGGGTVVQGPGCLNYNLTLRIAEDGPLTTVTGTNAFVMERNRAALGELLEASHGIKVAIQGCTDLAFTAPLTPPNLAPAVESKSSRTTENAHPETPWLKFSGNAQRRRRHALVFHGTLLHHFDLALIETLLRFPSAQPDYRASRAHTEFVRNIPAPADRLRAALLAAWNAQEIATFVPSERIAALVQERYAQEDWNLRR